MKKISWIIAVITFGVVIGCSEKDPMPKAPTINNSSSIASTTINNNSIHITGSLSIDEGSQTTTEKGLVYGKTENPTIANGTKVTVTDDDFTTEITDLDANTTYYFRLYATNTVNTVYGEEVSFMTTEITPTAPTLTATITETGKTTTTLNISAVLVVTDGTEATTETGIVWGTETMPDTTNKVVKGATDAYTIEGLAAETTYYIRGYATNAVGTTYSEEEVSFTTEVPLVAPTLTATISQTAATSTTLSISAVLVVMNGTETGIVWGTETMPDTTNKVVKGADDTYMIEGLTAETTYYIRGYATNSVGTTYSEEVTFTTEATPTVPTLTATITQTAATSTTLSISAVLVVMNGTETGIVWGTETMPDTTNKVVKGADDSYMIEGLTAETTYYIRGYATNSVGTTYSEEVSFTTEATPTVPTLTATITQTTATATTIGLEAVLTVTEGTSATTEMGIVWGVARMPTIATDGSNKVVKGADDSYTIVGLTAQTSYFVRGYVTNAVGTSYSDTEIEVAIRKPTLTATITETETTINSISVMAVLDITEGVPATTERGIVWGTATMPDLTNKMLKGADNTYTVSGLTATTTYYIRGYATNSVGTNYSEEVMITTRTPEAPTLTATITETATTINSITLSAVLDITERAPATTESGIVWGTATMPDLTNNKVIKGADNTYTVSGLTATTTYYIRGYATNSVGTNYSEEVMITTRTPEAPTLTATITETATTINSITLSAVLDITERAPATTESGIVWGTATMPDLTNNKVIKGADNTYTVSGLTKNTTYFIRGYATNSVGTNYSEEVMITTQTAFYRLENGVTIRARAGVTVGTTGLVLETNGTIGMDTYTLVDRAMLNTLKAADVNYTGADLSKMVTTGITDMSGLFAGTNELFSFTYNTFDQNISSWDTGNVTTMFSMFSINDAFNQNINSWNTSKVTTMENMFSNATAFDSPIGSWDVSMVTTMRRMFESTLFNQNISEWDVSQVLNMEGMFEIATKFNYDISGWTTCQVTNRNSFVHPANAYDFQESHRPTFSDDPCPE